MNEAIDKSKPLVVAIAGPTATGKTDAAVAVCLALQGEVLSMDSMQIYKRLSIGTAKPTVGEMQGVPHHLLSYVEPGATYTVADYQRDAGQVVAAILSRNRLPVFAGGTGLYLQAVSHPLTFAAVQGESAVRDALSQEAELPGGPARLFERLASVDPVSAQRLHVNNTRRVIRALEVFQMTGVPFSATQTNWEAESEQDFLIFALNYPRDVLYRRIDERVDRMIQAGLVEEVRALLHDGIPRNAQAMKAIGYKEIVAFLDGAYTQAEAIEAVKQNSRRYAKRQITWLRRDPRVRWIDIQTYGSIAAMHGELLAQINAYREKQHARD